MDQQTLVTVLSAISIVVALGGLMLTSQAGLRQELTADIGSLRTKLKADISSLRTELKDDIGSLRTKLKADISSLRTELRTDIGSLRTQLKTDIASLRTELKDTGAELKAEIADTRAELKTDIADTRADLRAEIANTRSELKTDIGKLGDRMTVIEQRTYDLRGLLSPIPRPATDRVLRLIPPRRACGPRRSSPPTNIPTPRCCWPSPGRQVALSRRESTLRVSKGSMVSHAPNAVGSGDLLAFDPPHGLAGLRVRLISRINRFPQARTCLAPVCQ